MTKVAIVGSREFGDLDRVREFVMSLHDGDEVVSGGARGVDSAAESEAKLQGLKVTVFPADWENKGKSAGFERNFQIVAYSDILIAFWDGTSRGTKDSIDKALKADNIREVRVFKE